MNIREIITRLEDVNVIYLPNADNEFILQCIGSIIREKCKTIDLNNDDPIDDQMLGDELLCMIDQEFRNNRFSPIYDRVDRKKKDEKVIDEELRSPTPTSSNRPADRYQRKPEKRTRYQDGNDSRWQTPPDPTKPNSPKQ